MVLIAFAVSGFASMAYEIVWTRLLVLIIGNSTYAFSAILSIYLLGLALGSFLFARLADRSKNLLSLFALLEFLVFLFVAITLPFIDNLPFLFQYLYNNFYSGFASLELIVFVVTAVIILIPTILMGATFPVANKIIISRTTCLGYSVGSTYSANTIGGIFGAFAAGFYFIPSLGIEKSMLLISFLNILACLILVFQMEKKKVIWKGSLATAMIIFFAFYVNWLPEWNRNYLNRGVYVYADWFDENFEGVDDNLRAFFNEKYKLKLYREGKIGTVAVTDIGGQLALQVNGKTEGSTGFEDMRTQTMVSAIPLMLKGYARDVAIIGMGTGVSLGVAEQFNVENIDCIELSEDVIEASRLFSRWNHDALNDPKMNLIMGDGRNYLTYTEKKYDVIINEPSNPWISGVSNLFTLEFFELAKARLKKNGLMAQWIQLYSLDTSELKVILGTFKTVFPHVSVWMFSPSDIVVVGSSEPSLSGYANIEKAFNNRVLAQDLRALGINGTSDVIKGYLFGSRETDIFVKNSPLNTDNFPGVEFEAPKALHRPSPLKNVQALRNCC
jgi:spermidine synthase